MTALTHRQALCLAFICHTIRSQGFPPTLREIGQHMSIRSTNGVNDHLRALERKGYIIRTRLSPSGAVVARGIRVLSSQAGPVVDPRLHALRTEEQSLLTRLREVRDDLARLEGGARPVLWVTDVLGDDKKERS